MSSQQTRGNATATSTSACVRGECSTHRQTTHVDTRMEPLLHGYLRQIVIM